MRARKYLPLVFACGLTGAASAQQPPPLPDRPPAAPTPAAAPAPAAPDDVRMIRLKISAGDFVLVDRKGTVVRYSPTRMTEERLSSAIEDLLR